MEDTDVASIRKDGDFLLTPTYARATFFQQLRASVRRIQIKKKRRRWITASVRCPPLYFQCLLPKTLNPDRKSWCLYCPSSFSCSTATEQTRILLMRFTWREATPASGMQNPSVKGLEQIKPSGPGIFLAWNLMPMQPTLAA